MLRLRSLAVLFAPLLALAACGSDSSADPGPYIDALEADFQGSGGPEGDSSRCLAESVVDAIGADTLEDADITPLEFADASSLQDLDIDVDTDDVRADLESSLGDCALGEAFADLMLAEFPVPVAGADRDCIVEAINDSEPLAISLAAGFVDGDEAEGDFESALAQSFAECPQVIGNLIADSIDANGIPVDDAARTCIIDEVEAGGAAFVDAIVAGGAGSTQLGADLAEACLPDAAG